MLLSTPEPPTDRRTVIEVRGVHKSFRIPSHRVDSLKERLIGAGRGQSYKELRALVDIDFDVAKGECLGIIGRNGSGKSTMLKLLASIYRVDRGSIRIAGRLVPFIELGVGFNPELTAHENVVLNGVMMGLTPRQARHRLDAVIDFAELREFEDLKLKNYSSGMLVRLGFSLMTQVDADIFLVDEVLAVGDASFQQKCFDVFSDLHSEGRTIVLITHDMGAVERHCDRALLLEGGVIEVEGDPADVTSRYLQVNFEDQASTRAPEDVITGEHAYAVFRDVRVNGAPPGETGSAEQGTEIELEFVVSILHDLERPAIGFQIVREDNYMVFAQMAYPEGDRFRAGDEITLKATIDNRLASGHYFVHCGVGFKEVGRMAAFRKNAAGFIVYGWGGFGGMVNLEHRVDLLQDGVEITDRERTGGPTESGKRA
jgi:ABC-type polysaccharide/polyol phosphate transport system ATPase subunit